MQGCKSWSWKALAVFCCLAAPTAQASQLQNSGPNWSYSFTVAPSSIVNSNVAINFYGSEGQATGSSNVTLGQIQIRIGDGATVVPSGSKWTGTLTLSDASGASTPLTFQSTLSGNLSSWNIVTSLLQPVSATLPAGWSNLYAPNGQREYVWKSSTGNEYSVTPEKVVIVGGLPSAAQGGSPISIGGYVFTANPNAAGSIVADVQVSPRSGTPEPSSLALAGLGALGLATRLGWGRSRRVA
jgi:PEP-CTERM motif-containing protein